MIHNLHGTVCHCFFCVVRTCFINVFLHRNDSPWAALLVPVVGALLVILIVGHPPMGPAGQRLHAENYALGHHARFLVLFGT